MAGAVLVSSHLGIEIGLRAVRAVVVDGTGEIVTRGDSALPATVEIETDLWFEGLREAVSRLGEARGEVASVGLAATEGAYTFLDGAGVTMRPTPLPDDRRAEPEARELLRSYGRPVRISELASRLLWWKRHRTESFRRARRVVTARDLLFLRLTGMLRSIESDASTTRLFDLDRGWRKGEAEVIDARIPDLLSAVAPDASVPRALLLDDAADFLTLRRGIPVHPGGTTGRMTSRAVGIRGPGPVLVRLGRVGSTSALNKTRVSDPDGWCDSSLDGGEWMAIRVPIPDLLRTVHEAAAMLGHAAGGALDEIFETDDPGSRLLVLPSLERIDLPGHGDPRGAILGVAEGELRPVQIYRATATGAALHIAWGLEQLREVGVAVSQIELTATELPTGFARLVAEVCGLPVRGHEEAYLGAIGAAWVAGGIDGPTRVGKWIVPNTARARRYQELRERFQVEMRRRYRFRPDRSRRDPPPGYVQRLLSADW